MARGLADLAGIAPDIELLARAAGRGERSSVGCWTFAGPGFVVEAGVREPPRLSPLVACHPMPPRWRCVLAVARDAQGLCGDAERLCFSRLSDRAHAEPCVPRLLLTALLPGLVTGDIEEFGVALARIQREMGALFAAQQGGLFHPRAKPLVEALRGLGVEAVGQSSWGPTVYGIVDGAERAVEVASELRARVPTDSEVGGGGLRSPGRQRGARRPQAGGVTGCRSTSRRRGAQRGVTRVPLPRGDLTTTHSPLRRTASGR